MPDQLNKQEISMLRDELEMLMNERARLLKVVGAEGDKRLTGWVAAKYVKE